MNKSADELIIVPIRLVDANEREAVFTKACEVIEKANRQAGFRFSEPTQ